MSFGVGMSNKGWEEIEEKNSAAREMVPSARCLPGTSEELGLSFLVRSRA